jgi:O-antigen ligase
MKKVLLNHTYSILAGAFFFILLFNVWTVTKLPIRDMAFTTMEWTYYLAIFMLGYALQKYSFWEKRVAPFYIGIVFFSIMYVLIHIINGNYYDNSQLTAVLLTMVFIASMTLVNWQKEQIALFAYISVAAIFLIMMHWLVLGHPSSQFQSYIRNPNILGVFISCLLFFPLAALHMVKQWGKGILLIGIAIAFVLIYVSSARAVILLLLTVFGAKLVLMVSKKLFSLLFFAVILFNFVFFMVYSLLAKTKYFTTLNNLSIETFGKSFFSGREDIWEPALRFGLHEPFFGYWIGIAPKDYLEGTNLVHAHNQYLQLFLESGIVGIACFVLFLFGIWKVYQRGIDSKLVQWSACFFLGILIYQNVEISLFFNMQPIGIFQWLIIAVGISGVVFSKTRDGIHIGESQHFGKN